MQVKGTEKQTLAIYCSEALSLAFDESLVMSQLHKQIVILRNNSMSKNIFGRNKNEKKQIKSSSEPEACRGVKFMGEFSVQIK